MTQKREAIIIGAGLVDALTGLSGGDTNAGIENIDKLSKGIADSLKNAGEFINRLEDLKPVLIAVGVVAAAAFFPVTTAIAGAIYLMGSLNKEFKKLDFSKGIIPGGMGNISMTVSGQVNNQVLKTQTKVTKLTKEQQLAQNKILKDKRLTAAIDKANLALNKGTDVFDLDKIQVAAALTNQAEQLGKATNSAQILQIANDTARLRVKQSIAALEDAIAAKDEAAITKATAKLNEDLKILGALTGQKTQVAAIESILKGLVPKELIDQDNLNLALLKIKQMLDELAKFKWPTGGPTGGPTGPTGPTKLVEIPPILIDNTNANKLAKDAADKAAKAAADAAAKAAADAAAKGATDTAIKIVQTDTGIKALTTPRTTEQINKAVEELGGVVSVIGENGKEFTKLVDGAATVFQAIDDAGAFNALVNSFAKGTINSFNAGAFRTAEGGSTFSSGAVGSRDRDIVITVNTGIGDPNAIAEAINQYIIDAVDRGTLRSGAY